MSNPIPYAVVRGPIDLTTCDLEPVHLLGTVQSHGALLIFDRRGGALREASANWRSYFPSAAELTAPTLRALFEPEVAAALEAVELSDRSVVLAHSLPGQVEIAAHRLESYLIVELESTERSLPFDPVGNLNGVMQGISQAQGSADYLRSLAGELQSSIGIDRVMIYRFLPDWTGEVVAESSSGPQEYLGLRFPSTDIPAPAREVFAKVWVRHIADVSAAAIPVTASSGELSGLDLTQVSLRASSPIHLEYLTNMGVAASLTLSIRVGEKLWGLVACHHKSPFLLRPSARAGLEILAQMISFQLTALLQSETREERQECENQLGQLEARLELSEDGQLASYLAELESLIDCDMVAVYEDQRWSRKAGLQLDALDRFLDWVSAETGEEHSVFHRATMPPNLVPGFAGVLSLTPAGPQGKRVCWFRREQAQSVRWAGNPDKSVRALQPNRLNPRASFAEYVEITRDTSLSWTGLDLWKADRLGQLLKALSLRMHRRLELKNQALARSNRELDSFAYMASHDLQEPLRGIHNYATFLKEDYGDRLDGDGTVFLDGLTELVGRMSMLVDSLLAYSRLNNQRLEVKDCDLEALATETCRLLKVTRKAQIEILRPLPVVQAYPPFLGEIVLNLLTNAIKYTDEPDRRIELGALPSDGDYDTFYVQDNGIGISKEFHDEIFHLFRRLHGEGQRGNGAGVGLTIVQKMVERHQGKIWVESEPGRGSTFFVSLPRLLPSGDAPVD